MSSLVVLGFARRTDANRASRRLATAVVETQLDIEAASVLGMSRDGRSTVRHGLPRTAAQNAEWTLLCMGPLYGAPVQLESEAVERRLPRLIDNHVIEQVSAVLCPGQAALAVIIREPLVLILAELVRAMRPTVVLTELEPVERGLLTRALAADACDPSFADSSGPARRMVRTLRRVLTAQSSRP